MTYQTELPEGFKTWNELWSVYRLENEGNDYFFVKEEAFNVNEVCRNCYEEIIELANSYEDLNHDFIDDFKNLTHPH